MTVTAATKTAGVDRTTFYLWRNNDALFAAALFQAQDEYADELNAQVRGRAREAIAAIRRIVTDEAAPPAVQLKARSSTPHKKSGGQLD